MMFLLLLNFCMSFYKKINIVRIASDLKNGLPISANIKHKLSQTASKKFYFAKDCIHPEICKKLQNPKFITTDERKKNKNDITKYEENAEEIEIHLLNLLKTLELLPILIKVETLPDDFENEEILQTNEEEIINFTSNFIYDIKLASKAPIALKNAQQAEFFVFSTLVFNKEHYVLKIGNPEKDEYPLVRIHSSCYTGDLLASLRCDCRDQLQETIKLISENKDFHGGYILYLMQEGRGIGLKNKIEAYRLQQQEGLDTVDSNLAIGYLEDERSFIPAVKMMQFFNINNIVLITNNPKKITDLTSLGINVSKTMHTVFAQNEYNKDYLKIKEVRMLHNFK